MVKAKVKEMVCDGDDPDTDIKGDPDSDGVDVCL